MKDRYATVSFPTFELQKGEPLLPPIVWPVPDKSYRVQKPFAFQRLPELVRKQLPELLRQHNR
jgi:hypothetical protein